MRKEAKVILPLFLLITLIAGMITNAYAFTIVQTHIIDNDDAQGYYNGKDGFDTTIQGSTLYYQDARTQVCNSKAYFYRYYFKAAYTRYTPIYGKISAYLYNAKFTDPAAFYGFNPAYYNMVVPAGYINQDLAAAGWNVIGTAKIETRPAGDLYWARAVELEPSSTNPTKYCGADAIKAELGYE